MFHIVFYRDKDGKSEIVDFLDELQEGEKQRDEKGDKDN